MQLTPERGAAPAHTEPLDAVPGGSPDHDAMTVAPHDTPASVRTVPNADARVLFVDDEQLLLDGLRRTLRGRYAADFALGPIAALEMLETNDYAIVVSDMRMPEMDGPTFLACVTEQRPEIVQMILSGQADLTSTIAAVNQGEIFRFLVKPIDRTNLFDALDRALELVRLRRAERELLEQTLGGVVDVLGEILSVTRPQLGRRARIVESFVDRLLPVAGLADDWRLQMAIRLAGVGEVTLPDELVGKLPDELGLSALQRGMIRRHPLVAGELVGRIPRLGDVAEIVRCQHGDALPASDELADHARFLRVVLEIASHIIDGDDERTAVRRAVQRGDYPAAWVTALSTEPSTGGPATVTVDDLQIGMRLCDDLCTLTGLIVAPAKTLITAPLLERIQNFVLGAGIVEPIAVELADPTGHAT